MIQNYLLSNCLLLIEEMNQKFKHVSREELKYYADHDFSEADLVFLLSYYFKNLVSFNLKGRSGDIEVKSLDFLVEVKHLRNTKSSGGNYTNTPNWNDTFQKDFDWLCEHIRKGNKGKRAFILGWFNAVESFSQILHLGLSSDNKSGGAMPSVNAERMKLFPFLNVPTVNSKTKDVTYMYTTDIYSNDRYEPSTIKVEGLMNNYVNCLFLGKPTDKFHFAIYY